MCTYNLLIIKKILLIDYKMLISKLFGTILSLCLISLVNGNIFVGLTIDYSALICIRGGRIQQVVGKPVHFKFNLDSYLVAL